MSHAAAILPAMKVDPVRKRTTGRASFQEGVGAVFLEKCHQKEGLRMEMMLSWVMIVSAMYITATTCITRTVHAGQHLPEKSVSKLHRAWLFNIKRLSDEVLRCVLR